MLVPTATVSPSRNFKAVTDGITGKLKHRDVTVWDRGVNLYGLSVSRTDVCDLHGLTMQFLRIFMIFADSHVVIPLFIFKLLWVCSDTIYASWGEACNRCLQQRTWKLIIGVTTSCVLFAIVYGCVIAGSEKININLTLPKQKEGNFSF